MRINQLLTRKDRGQAAILIAVVIMLAAVFMVALLIDGGLAMLSRRQAQAAADAGALAGANVICSRLSNTSVTGTAVDYAIRNKATTATATRGGFNNTEVTVTANITNTPFFASFLGKRSVTTTATATAGCYSPDRMTHVLPLAWTAFPGHDWSEYANDYNTFNTNNPSGLLSVFIDGGNGNFSDAYLDTRDIPETTCKGETAIDPNTQSPTPGLMNCSSADGVQGGVQAFGGNDRAWIGLDHGFNRTIDQWLNWLWGDWGGGWITISPPSYYGSASAGGFLSYFILWLIDESPFARHWGSDLGHVWFLPTYDPSKSGNGIIWVDGFSTFYMTCVNYSQHFPGQSYTPSCQGARAWWNANTQYQDKYDGFSVEGYFLANYPYKLTGKGGRDSGLHYVSLSQ